MKISIVTAVYNRSDTIGQAIRSVQSQTYQEVEHIIQDGGSTDGTLDVIAKLADERTRLASGPDEGIYDAINKGIMRATGDVVGLMHSDDFFVHDGILEKLAGIFSDPGIDGVYGDLQYVSKDDTSRVIRHWKAGAYTPAKLRRGWMPPHPTFYLRREVYDRWGLYDKDFRIAADYDAMLRYLVKGNINIAYHPETIVKMRAGGASNRSLKQIIRKMREDIIASRRNGIGGFKVIALKNLSKISQLR